MEKYLDISYPTITDELSARKAASFGYYGAAAIALFTMFIIALKLYRSDSPDFIDYISRIIGDVLPIAFIGIMIYRMSRVAAIIAFAYCIAEIFFKYSERGSVGIFPLLLIFFLSSIRGTFAFHRYRNKQISR